jgi:hypothetical protein
LPNAVLLIKILKSHWPNSYVPCLFPAQFPVPPLFPAAQVAILPNVVSTNPSPAVSHAAAPAASIPPQPPTAPVLVADALNQDPEFQAIQSLFVREPPLPQRPTIDLHGKIYYQLPAAMPKISRSLRFTLETHSRCTNCAYADSRSRTTCGITVRFIRPPIVLLRGLHIIRLSKASQRVGSRQNRLPLLLQVPLLPLLHRSPASLMEVSVPSQALLFKPWQATMLVSIMRPRLHLQIIHGMNSNNTSPRSSKQQISSPSTSK